MKRYRREILREWKEDCVRKNISYATLPTQAFPKLLNLLMQKDFSNAISGGFEATGIYPFNPNRVLAKLPHENRENVVSDVHQQLLKKLSGMRYSPAATTSAQRPKKKDKLPPGASYTCAPGAPIVASAVVVDDVDDPAVQVARSSRRTGTGIPPFGDSADETEDSSSSSDSEDSSGSEPERSRMVKNIIARLARKRPLQDDNEPGTGNSSSSQEDDKQQQMDEEEVQIAAEYPAGVYVVAVYQEEWYVGQVMEKEGEPEAEKGDEYIFVNFMMRTVGDKLQWPRRLDLLNVLKVDILFTCQPPTPSAGTSSSRSITYSLSKEELKKAKHLFMLNKAYYPTSISPALVTVPYLLCVCVCVCVCGGVCVCVCVCTVLYCTVLYRTV
jgi:hypothetical protein